MFGTFGSIGSNKTTVERMLEAEAEVDVLEGKLTTARRKRDELRLAVQAEADRFLSPKQSVG